MGDDGWSLRVYHERRAAGLCRHCEQPATPGPRGGMIYCDACRARDKELHYAKRLAYNNRRYREFREQIIEMYGGKCIDCGKLPPARMELHHLDMSGKGERMTPSGKNGGAHPTHNRLAMNGKDDNLVLLCVSCHRMRHHQTLKSDNTSGAVGVSWNRDRWAAEVQIAGKRHRLGRFDSVEEAATAREAFLRSIR